MSLVGPRPERPEFVAELEKALPRYKERMAVRPGITGLAQVQLGADIDLESVRRKLAHDLHYIENTSFWLDFRILASTALRMFGIPFHLGRSLFFLPGGKRVQEAYDRTVAQDQAEKTRDSLPALPAAVTPVAAQPATELQPA
jgi:hypothetical protein